MTMAWDPKLISQRDQVEKALAGRCNSCGQSRQLPPIQLHSAVEIALEAFGIEMDELVGRGHDPIATAARALVVWGLRTLGGPHSYSPIGRALGRGHSTIINLHQKAIVLRERSKPFAAACDRMVARYFAEMEIHHGSN